MNEALNCPKVGFSFITIGQLKGLDIGPNIGLKNSPFCFMKEQSSENYYHKSVLVFLKSPKLGCIIETFYVLEPQVEVNQVDIAFPIVTTLWL